MPFVVDRPSTPGEAARLARAALVLLGLLFAARLAFAGIVPLAYDEAYYWAWSKHLAGGYLDHPSAVAVLIRAGTTLAGDTAFGVRLAVILGGIPATWAVWRATAALIADPRSGPVAAVLFNLMLLVGGGLFLATPDAPLLVASAFALLCFAEIACGGRAEWWLALGAAVGGALLSKYSALFFGVGIAGWVLAKRGERRWLTTPWPYAGAAIAVAVFAPVLLWNAEHGWVSFIKQFGRARVEGWSPRYLPEFVVVQIALVTPPIAALAAVALARPQDIRTVAPALSGVVAALSVPFLVYFSLHALHARVEGNWLAPIYPALAVLAAAGALLDLPRTGFWRATTRLARASAAPFGVALIAIVYLQAAFGVIPLGGADPTARQLGSGWPDLARDIDALAVREQASAVVTTQYATTGWLRFYLPAPKPVVQINDRIRWVNEPPPSRAALGGTLLYVCHTDWDDSPAMRPRFASFDLIATLPRLRRGVVVERYNIYRANGARSDPLDPIVLPQTR